MVCVLDSSSPCAWSGFMRDASRLDSGFFSSSFLFPFFDLRISLAQHNCRSWHRAVAYFTFKFFIYYILFPFQLGNLSLVYSEFVFLSRSLVGGYWAQLAYTCCVGPRYLVRWGRHNSFRALFVRCLPDSIVGTVLISQHGHAIKFPNFLT